MTYTVWIPGLPPKVTNGRMGWRAYYGARVKWLTGAARIIAHSLGKVPRHEKIRVQITAYVPALSDQDNINARAQKAAHDLLTYKWTAMIPDDSPRHIEGRDVIQVVVGRAPRKPKDPNQWPTYGKRMMAHVNKLGLSLAIEPLS